MTTAFLTSLLFAQAVTSVPISVPVTWEMPPRPPMRRPDPVKILTVEVDSPVIVTPIPSVTPSVTPAPGPVLSVSPVSPISGSISVTVSPIPKSAADRILSTRAAKVSMPWLVTLRNDSPEAVTVYESAVLARIPHLSPFDHESMSLLIAEAETNSLWQRAGRAGEDVVKLGAFLAASKSIRIGDTALVAITATLALSPYIIQRLRGSARPVRQNWERLAWSGPVTLQPGETAARHLFTAKWESPMPVSFMLETGVGRAVRVVR